MTVDEIKNVIANAIFLELYQANMTRTSGGRLPTAKQLSMTTSASVVNELVRTGVLVIND